MGRGMARQRRIAEYFSKNCIECQKTNYRKAIRSCGHPVDGVWVPQFTEAQIDQKVAERFKGDGR